MHRCRLGGECPGDASLFARPVFCSCIVPLVLGFGFRPCKTQNIQSYEILTTALVFVLLGRQAIRMGFVAALDGLGFGRC